VHALDRSRLRNEVGRCNRPLSRSPATCLVFCVDEKTAIRAARSTRPGAAPCRWGAPGARGSSIKAMAPLSERGSGRPDGATRHTRVRWGLRHSKRLIWPQPKRDREPAAEWFDEPTAPVRFPERSDVWHLPALAAGPFKRRPQTGRSHWRWPAAVDGPGRPAHCETPRRRGIRPWRRVQPRAPCRRRG
jgi:hypothetical protein